MLKISNNVSKIEDEVLHDKFNLKLQDHILYLPSFIDSNLALKLITPLISSI